MLRPQLGLAGHHSILPGRSGRLATRSMGPESSALDRMPGASSQHGRGNDKRLPTGPACLRAGKGVIEMQLLWGSSEQQGSASHGAGPVTCQGATHELTLWECLLQQQPADPAGNFALSGSVQHCAACCRAQSPYCPGLTWSNRMSRNLAALNSVAPNMLWKGSWAAL